MVEVNFTVEIGLPVPGSSIREGGLCEVQCVAQQASPRGDIDVYALLLEGWGTEQIEHRIEILPKGMTQQHKILQFLSADIWKTAQGHLVTSRLEEEWAAVKSSKQARRAENVGAL